MEEKNHLREVFQYFAQFHYAPSMAQVHTFYTKKISLLKLKFDLAKLASGGELQEQIIDGVSVYAMKNEERYIETRCRRLPQSKDKLKRAQKVANLIAYLPQIQLVGLSGSVAVMNARPADDIDFFIITKPRELWTGRFLVLLLLQLLGVRRGYGEKKVTNKICCNLFFDGRELSVPFERQSIYTAHEVFQMVPLVSKRKSYERFMKKNEWALKMFPNAKLNKMKALELKKISKDLKTLSIFSIGENILKKFQQTLINRHKTNERVTDTQLWFYPNARHGLRRRD